MAQEPIKNLLPRLSTRREYFDYLDRWTVGTVDELRARMTTRALCKAYMLETSHSNGKRDALAALGGPVELAPVDDTLFRLTWAEDDGDWALVEIEDQRYPVVYTMVESDVANRRIERMVASSPLLDRSWFAAQVFLQLWSVVIAAYPAHRFSRLVFEHESVFQRPEVDAGESAAAQADEADALDTGDPEHEAAFERRRARVQITERIGKMVASVLPWTKSYDPLASIIQLRVPAPVQGGHDVYYNGQFTNRSDSMLPFRQTVRDVMQLYRTATERVEGAAWPRADESSAAPSLPVSLGAPLLIQFSEMLDLETFKRWIAALHRKNNRFRLWGNPIWLGEGKAHLYAVDNHLWQPIDLEITRDHVYALLPQGTCGNTVHRLVTNIQRFVDPKLRVFIGEKPYEDFVAGAVPDNR